MKQRTLLRFAIAGLLILAGMAAWIYAPSWRWALDRVQGLGAWGPAGLAAVYVPAALLLVPGSLLTLLGGFAFGVPKAFAAVSAGSVAGACTAFLVSRYLLRDWVERKLADSPRLQALDRAVEEQGFKIVFLARLSPLLPFGVLNYAFGASNISFGRYALATWLGMLPGTLAYCYLGSAAQGLTDLATGNSPDQPLSQALYFAGLAVTVVVTAVVTRIATRALREAVHERDS